MWPFVRGILGFMNTHVWRWAWFRVSWNEEKDDEPSPLIPGTMKIHFPVHPDWLFSHDKEKKA